MTIMQMFLAFILVTPAVSPSPSVLPTTVMNDPIPSSSLVPIAVTVAAAVIVLIAGITTLAIALTYFATVQ